MNPLVLAMALSAAPAELSPVFEQVTKQHTANVERLRKWIALPSIAAEGLNTQQGVKHMMGLAKEAGFGEISVIEAGGKPAVFATLDAGAEKTVGLYLMYDVKQFDPAEWSSPPLAGKLADKPGLGKVMIGRGAENQKGPESALFAALAAFKAAGQKLPVNLVMIAEGEEEIGSPTIGKIMADPKVVAAFKKCIGVFMPSPSQGSRGEVEVTLGAKGVIELELVSSAEKWGRGAAKDVHSGERAHLDSPAFHLVQALNTLVDAKGDPAIDGFMAKAKPLTAEENVMIDQAAKSSSEADSRARMGVTQWARDGGWRQSLADTAARPTVNIEGLVAGHTGPGGKTVLPHKAVAKLDLRLVPDMTATESLALLKAHLAKRGFGDIEVNMSGGYDPTTTSASSVMIQKQVAAYRAMGTEPAFTPRMGGSWPGYAFTNPPLSLPAGHFGLGYGEGAHAPNEFFLIESTNPKIGGFDDAVKSYVQLFFEFARN